MDKPFAFNRSGLFLIQGTALIGCSTNHVVGSEFVCLTECEDPLTQGRSCASGDVHIHSVVLTERLITPVDESVTHKKGGVVKWHVFNFGTINSNQIRITKAPSSRKITESRGTVNARLADSGKLTLTS